MIRFGFAIAVVGFAVNALSAEPSKLSLKSEKVELPEALAKALKPEFTTDAFTIRDGDTNAMTLWFRKEIPAKASAEQIKNGLTYREIPEGTIVGVIEFPQVFTDYRKQKLAKGAYTLRFAIQPDIGDHTGTTPHPEFCLMCPAEKDKSAEPMAKKDLIELSSEVNEGKHPAVLLLFPYYAKDDGPKVASKENGVWIVNVRRAVNAKATLGFAITVAGQWKQ